jgi:hypothetical protein
LESLLYTSTSRIDPAVAESAVTALVTDAQARNNVTGLTGALIFTGTFFAQVFEGSSESVATLLRALQADERHSDMIILEHVTIAERRFSQWSLAYSGFSRFIDEQVARVPRETSPSALKRTGERLTSMMLQFVHDVR